MWSFLRYPNYYKKNTFFPPSIRMSGKNIKLGDKKINKSTLYKSKTIFNDIDDNDVNN